MAIAARIQSACGHIEPISTWTAVSDGRGCISRVELDDLI